MLGVRNSMRAVAAFLAVACAAPVAAQEKSKPAGRATKAPQPPPADHELLRINAEVMRSAAEYKEKLASLLELYERDAERLARDVESRAPLVEKGYIARRELEESELALARARARVEETRRQIEQAEIAIAEAEARAQLLTLPPLPTGGYSETGMLIRYNGGASWSLADAGKIEAFFAARFGHLLPVSARGETELHRRMKFDHSDAMDVAIHPDSVEGRALMDYLRKAGIPFVAFHNRVTGSSTGAHIHIGRPSLRLASP